VGGGSKVIEHRAGGLRGRFWDGWGGVVWALRAVLAGPAVRHRGGSWGPQEKRRRSRPVQGAAKFRLEWSCGQVQIREEGLKRTTTRKEVAALEPAKLGGIVVGVGRHQNRNLSSTTTTYLSEK